MNDSALKLLVRRNCALCDQLKFALDLMAGRLDGGYEELDIDLDRELVAQYGDTVPVLLAADTVIVAGHFDIETLETEIRSALSA